MHATLLRWPPIWRKQVARRFEALVAEQVLAAATTYIQIYLEHQDALSAYARGVGPIDTLVDPHPASRLIYRLIQAATEAGHDEIKAAEISRDFLLSPEFGRIPNVLIGSLLHAGLQHAYVSGGTLQAPSRGTLHDISMIASILPYVDAIFVDKEMHVLLTTNPVRDRLQYTTKVFSPRTWGSFLDYLQDIESSCSDEHRGLIAALYGELGCEPELDLFPSLNQ